MAHGATTIIRLWLALRSTPQQLDDFMVIRITMPYKGIMGGWADRNIAIRAVPSTAHGMLKFPVDGGIVTIYNTAAPPKECNTVTCDVTQTQRQHATKVTNTEGCDHPD
ncbi:hypothetical protein Tco_0838363 [Tanacetum coccineum]|uniref:Reverse transcriptase domain-containing protein n=1 Tax=Tanacetum coccineum TaxID=301880 RepID=A0ABQ5ARH9_9ASTR